MIKEDIRAKHNNGPLMTMMFVLQKLILMIPILTNLYSLSSLQPRHVVRRLLGTNPNQA
jgi:hypothetical protein